MLIFKEWLESILEMFSKLHTGFPFVPYILSNATYSTTFPISIGFIQVRFSCMKMLQKFSVMIKMKPVLVEQEKLFSVICLCYEELLKGTPTLMRKKE